MKKLETAQLNIIRGHLKTQFESCNPVLFTGAGFSYGCVNMKNKTIPMGKELSEILWELCYKEDKFEDSIKLDEIYQLACLRKKTEVHKLLANSFTINPDSITDSQKGFFDFPWKKVYTLNIDNFEFAMQKKHEMARRILSVDALSPSSTKTAIEKGSGCLLYIHLNGSLENIEEVTFSKSSYYKRLSSDDYWYSDLVSSLFTCPFVFIGTELDEPSFWMFIEQRKLKGQRSNFELRPKSYLVVPSLSLPRQEILASYNITWLPMTCDEFYTNILCEIKSCINKGLSFVENLTSEKAEQPESYELGYILSKKNKSKTDFLRGSEPEWADFENGKVANREFDNDLIQAVDESSVKLIAITGTAASGKSTSVKKMSLKLHADGRRILFFDRNNISRSRNLLKAYEKIKPDVIIIDDADQFGSDLTNICNRILDDNCCLVIVAMRSTKYDRCITTSLQKITNNLTMPLLKENDVNELHDVLERNNRLGVLESLSVPDRINAICDKCGRQLLVAMIEVTSGRKFEDKVNEEYLELNQNEKALYSVAAVVTALRSSIDNQSLMMAVEDSNNDSINRINNLCKYGMLNKDHNGNLKIRHPLIAERLLDTFISSGILKNIFQRLAYVYYAKCTPNMDTFTAPRRFLLKIINHDFLKRMLGVNDSRAFYNSIESFAQHDFGYWLQRGSLEVETDNLIDAEYYLNAARGKNPDDLNTKTEYAYLLFKKALKAPKASNSEDLISEAESILLSNIAARGKRDPHSYHVLLHNMLEWILVSPKTKDDKLALLQKIRSVSAEAQKYHFLNTRITHETNRISTFELEIIKSN